MKLNKAQPMRSQIWVSRPLSENYLIPISLAITHTYTAAHTCISLLTLCMCILSHSPAKGMKALREQNIVHRDLKPGNILIRHHPHTKKMLVSLLCSHPKLVT